MQAPVSLRKPSQQSLLPVAPRAPAVPLPVRAPLKVAGLFAGIGGIELGLAPHGHETLSLCEIDAGAMAVLRSRFPSIPLHDDVQTLKRLPRGVSLVTAGFPCQDLSQAGKTVGIDGARSGLVGEVFRLIRSQRAPWLLIENVPFMLRLSRGRALEVIISALEVFGYKWAYRVIDARSFGIPQRRERVYIVASLEDDPRTVLLSDDEGAPPPEKWGPGRSFGFYWTEGIRGLGAAVDAVPTLKGGSAVGIPSPPAVVLPDGNVILPDIRDLERLQGFDVEWTAPAEEVVRKGWRWKYVGNAVAVHVAHWLGKRLREPMAYDDSLDSPLAPGDVWPNSAWNLGQGRFRSNASAWPVSIPMTPIHQFLKFEPKPLSHRAVSGFLERASRSSLRFPEGFVETLTTHQRRMLKSGAPIVASPRRKIA
jgi:DNA (cytosine-5)-methyltransferase 1